MHVIDAVVIGGFEKEQVVLYSWCIILRILDFHGLLSASKLVDHFRCDSSTLVASRYWS